MEFYRYSAYTPVAADINGEPILSKLTPRQLQLTTYNLFKETPKGYWIGHGSIPEKLRGDAIWVSKTSKKRWAYPTKKEALVNFIRRTECHTKIVEFKLQSLREDLSIAKSQMEFLIEQTKETAFK